MNKLIMRFNQIIILIKYIYYNFYCKIFNIKNDDIWLISERGIDARDNGYVFFKYLVDNHPEINAKYVISKDSPDFEKISKISVPVIYGSKEHYILFITSGYLISTHLMGFSPNMGIFNKLNSNKRINVSGRLISLAHGIKNSSHPSLTFEKTKLDLIFLGGKKEVEMFKNNTDFGDRIKGCGLARYDNLISNTTDTILVMPTFRMWMTYYSDEQFKESKYFKEYNSLLNNKGLAELLSKNNYKLIFYPHIEFQKYIHLFNPCSENIIIGDINKYDVQKLLIESKLLITDYSSVFFDFAYMKKPVIYYHFDYDEYRTKHYKAGYFDYKMNGFGKVVDKELDLITNIENSFNNNFIFEKKYADRIDNFFAYNDQMNCKRIYDEIYKLSKENKNEK